MSKPIKFVGAKSRNAGRGVPFVVLVGFLGLGLISYVLSQMFLPFEAHLAHWLAALVGALLGGVLGWLWYHWRGDII